MRVGVFGASRVEVTGDDGEPRWVEAGARKPRSIVAALVLEPGRPLDADRLADLVWAGEPPRAPHGALHAYISRLRRVLEPGVLETTDHGYVLRVDPAHVDVHAFAADVRRVTTALAPLATQLGSGDTAAWPDRAGVAAHVETLEAALGAWTGRPYADLGDHPDVDAERAALDQLRLSAEQARVLGLLAVGEHAGLLSVTESAVAAHPLQERWWALHALALTRAGRQADALAALREVRDLLADELGLDPGPELQALERAILRQDAALLRTIEAAAPARTVPVAAPSAAPSAGVGRKAEQAALVELVERVATGQAGAALLVGEPGIGKSWLLERVTAYAAERGFAVGRGRCSQDDGAPPLWPWLQVLRDLDAGTSLADLVQQESPGESAARLAFETSDRISGALLSATADRPVLVVLDDLHWADEATLRTLRHVLDVLPADARLLVVATRRAHPEPTGAAALVAEAFARRHALRLDLAGLDREDAAELARSVSPRHVTVVQTAAWHRRSGGNPFFVVELARLGDTSDDVPVSVREVVGRRFEALPPRAMDTLRFAAALGRWFRAEVLAAVAARDVDEVLDDLEVARSVGLVAEDETGEFAFVHALTRDAVLRTVPPNRRARLHAELARVLASDAEVRRWYDDAELTADLALQWLAAGPSHADRAWPAARAAADLSHALSSYRDAMDLRRAAVEAHRRAAPDETERYSLLLELAREASYAAQWPAVVDASFEAMALARSLGSPEQVAEAAAGLTTYVVWTPHDWLEIFEDAVDDLRWALATLPEDDSVARCRLLLALAVELYYDVGAVAERRALVEAGLALARRLGDPAVLWWSTRAAYIASWAPSFTLDRIGWGEEGLAAAREAGDPAAEAVSLVCLANDHLELGQMAEWERLSAEADALARRERLPYVLFTLRWVESTLEALRGHREERDRRLVEIAEVVPDVAVPSIELMVPAMAVVARMWEPELSQYAEPLQMMAAMSPMSRGTMHALLGRAVGADAVRASLEHQPYVEPLECWQTLMTACCEAEAASMVGDVVLARRVRETLVLYPERNALAGVAVVVGPVAGYLALADATLGDLEAATRNADLGLRLADERGFPPYRDWLLAHRARLGF